MTETTGSDNLLGNFDADRWAQGFVQVRRNLLTGPERRDIADDQETMHTWFAGAIMTGYDHYDPAAAVAAERERIAVMADRLAATVPTGDGPLPFSAVIRHVPQDGDDPEEP